MEINHSRGTYQVDFTSVNPESLRDLFVVTDRTVAEHWRSLFPGHVLELPPGESTKSLIWLERISAWLAGEGAHRKSVLAAVGGGVIGDVAGFAAATYMRGIRYIQVPTTLLAQVDSSVGGKVAVDLPEGKNLVGAFYPPERVLIDTEFLKTLSQRQFRNGMAEVCKTAFIIDAGLATTLGYAKLDSTSSELQRIVERCIAHKAGVVEEDEFETLGRRAILNFGHTVGHAIEQATSYTAYLHGEAIAIGMIVEAILGEQLGVTPKGIVAEVRRTLAVQGLTIDRTHLPASEQLITAMRRDKKATDGRLAFSLLTEIGGCKLVADVGASEVVAALTSL